MASILQVGSHDGDLGREQRLVCFNVVPIAVEGRVLRIRVGRVEIMFSK